MGRLAKNRRRLNCYNLRLWLFHASRMPSPRHLYAFFSTHKAAGFFYRPLFLVGTFSWFIGITVIFTNTQRMRLCAGLATAINAPCPQTLHASIKVH
jgi:hypothetical protein